MAAIGVRKGQRVCYYTAPGGGYSEFQILDYRFIVPVPEDIEDSQVVTCLTKAVAAHYLLRRTFYMQQNVWTLIHAAAGGLGHFLVQLALYYNAQVIATAGGDNKLAFLQSLGCQNVINYVTNDFELLVRDITRNDGVHVVYDSVGGTNVEKSLNCLSDLGILVLTGCSSGHCEKIDPFILSKRCNFITSTRLQLYKKDRKELLLSAMHIFDLIRRGIIGSIPGKVYNFDEIPLAHTEIESRLTIGSQIVQM
jgi:NADPH2:quinone reductase